MDIAPEQVPILVLFGHWKEDQDAGPGAGDRLGTQIQGAGLPAAGGRVG